MDIKQVLELIKTEFQKNYNSGDPKIPPHRHTGNDNLQINPNDLLGYQIFNVTDATIAPTDDAMSGALRFQYDGTNFSMWVRNEQIWSQVGSGGGGGGSPGGNDTNVQFNDSGSFGGDDAFEWDKVGKILLLDKGTGPNDGDYISSGTSDLYISSADNNSGSGGIQIFTGAVSDSDAVAGDIYIAGLPTGDFSKNIYGADIFIYSGGGSSASAGLGKNGNIILLPNGIVGPGIPFFDRDGTIVLKAAEAHDGTPGGHIILEAGDDSPSQPPNLHMYPADSVSGYSPTHGEVVLFTGLNTSIGTRGNFELGTGNLIINNSATPTSSNVQGSIIMFNTTAPSASTTGAGILYVESGALKYRGAGGTVTTIAAS